MNEREIAFRRRAALVQAGVSTYILRHRGLGLSSYRTIICLCCGMESYNQNDVQQAYCSHCHAWHSDTWVEFITSAPTTNGNGALEEGKT